MTRGRFTGPIRLIDADGNEYDVGERGETIGASGIVFGYATYLITRFFFSRRVVDLAFGLVVLFVWGASLLASLAPTPGVSWQAHLFGAIGGVVAARFAVPAGQRERPRHG